MSRKKEDRCYLCNIPVRKYKAAPGEQLPDDQRTRDHLPPENLFPEGLRNNLITVTCCYSCNKSFSKLDEQFRVFVSAATNVSAVGKQIMKQKVFGGSLKKSPSLKRQMGRDVFLGTVITTLGPMTTPLIAMNQDVLDAFFIRITKGLLATFYPDVNYFGLHFGVTQLNQFGADHPTFKKVTSMLTFDQRGNGVFRVWHGVTQEDGTTGIWIYQFYEAALFLVKHSGTLWPNDHGKGELS